MGPFPRWMLASFAFLSSSAAYGFCNLEPYIGLGIGPETAYFKQKAQVLELGPGNTRIIDKKQLGAQGGFISLFAGLGFRFPILDPNCENFYLGTEVNVNARSLKHKTTNDEFINVNFNHDIYRMKRDAGISLLPGIFFSDCSLLYARLGYAVGRFKVDSTDTTLQNISRNLNGFRFGLGFRQFVNSCWSFRLEYNQTNYQKAKMFIFDPVGVVYKNTSITPHTARFEFAVMFQF